jgi:hypothetical protein
MVFPDASLNAPGSKVVHWPICSLAYLFIGLFVHWPICSLAYLFIDLASRAKDWKPADSREPRRGATKLGLLSSPAQIDAPRNPGRRHRPSYKLAADCGGTWRVKGTNTKAQLASLQP